MGHEGRLERDAVLLEPSGGRDGTLAKLAQRRRGHGIADLHLQVAEHVLGAVLDAGLFLNVCASAPVEDAAADRGRAPVEDAGRSRGSRHGSRLLRSRRRHSRHRNRRPQHRRRRPMMRASSLARVDSRRAWEGSETQRPLERVLVFTGVQAAMAQAELSARRPIGYSRPASTPVGFVRIRHISGCALFELCSRRSRSERSRRRRSVDSDLHTMLLPAP